MTDFDAFERRFAGRLHDYADAMPVAVDPVAVADRVASGVHRSWLDRLGIAPGEHWRPSWMVAALLLLGLVTAGVMVGARLLERDQAPLELSAFDVALIAPGRDGNVDALTTADGATWAVLQGTVVRFDPTSGVARTWDISDGPIFAGPPLAAAADGGVWLIGYRQVRRFDGVSLGPSIEGPAGVEYLSDFAEGPDGTLWASSDQGVFRYRDGRWTGVGPDPTDGSPDRISAGSIAVDASGTVWASLLRYPGPSSRGIGRYDGSRWEIITDVGDGTTFPVITSLTASSDAVIWAGAAGQGRLYRHDRRGWTSFGPDLLGAAGSWRAVPGPDGTVFAATEFPDGAAAMVRFDRSGVVGRVPVTGLPVPDADGWSEVRIAASGDGLMAAMSSGLYRLTTDRWERTWPTAGRELVPSLDVATVDRDEAWGLFGAAAGNATEVWHLTETGASTEGIGSSAKLRDVAVDRDGNPWVASTIGLSVRTTAGWRVIDGHDTSAVEMDPDGAVWVAQGQAIRRFESNGGPYVPTAELAVPRFERWTDFGGQIPLLGAEMAVDSHGGAWLPGGIRGMFGFPGLYRVDGDGAEVMTPVPDSDRTVFEDIAITPDGTVWVTIFGTGSWSTSSVSCCETDPATQVASFADGRWTVYGKADGLPIWARGSTSLEVAPSGDVWFSTMSGLYRFDGTRWRAVIPDVDLGSISAGRDGTIWASGPNGVIRITQQTR